MPYPVVPEYITVHLGAPDAPAENVTVTFPDYIKNVASSEIYPTWNESAIRANVLAQISVALNRVYTEFYRSRGYDFDITNNTQYDQAFSPDKETFENINAIVDDIFNNYIVRRGNVEPLYAQFCDGVRTQCRGLSQWGSQELAQQGRTPYEILQYYYGQDIDLVYNAPVGDSTPSYPGRPLTVGSVGEDIRTIQRELNRIRKNYPAIPAIAETDGVFGADTAAAVRTFQRIFNLTQDGIVGKGTWYRIKSIYNGVKSLSEVTSEGLTISEAQRQFPKVLRLGDTGIGVQTIRFYLAFLGFFLPELPLIECFEYTLDRANGVEQISVQRFSIFALHDGQLRVDEAFLLQLPHVLCHRIFTHADRMTDGFVTGVALVGLPILAPEQIGIEGDLTKIQTDAEYLVWYHKIVFLCTALGPFVETQFIPPVLL